MAYTHSKYEVMIKQDAAIATAATFEWAPGMVPHIVRAIALVFTLAPNATDAIVVQRRPVAGAAANQVTIDTVNLVVANCGAGEVMYVTGLDTEIAPGEDLAVVLPGTSTAGTAHIIAYVEPRWETPANNTKMTVSA